MNLPAEPVEKLMAAILSARTREQLLEVLADFRLPASADAHLQRLMDRNNDGQLSSDERDGLNALVELGSLFGLLQAQSMSLLGRKSALADAAGW
jgi:hypothetical protein